MALAFAVYFILLAVMLSHALLVTRKEYTTPAYYFVCLGVILLFALVTGLRDDVGLDFHMYAQHFREVGRYVSLDERYEPVFEGINIALSALGLGTEALFITVAFIEISLLYLAFSNKQALLPCAVLFYFITGQLFFDMNITRHALATMVFIYSLRYLASGDFWKYLACILIAMGFHTISTVLILVWFLRTDKPLALDSPLLCIILFAITAIIGPVVTKVLIDPFIDVFRFMGYKNYVYLVDQWEMEINSGLGMIVLKALDLTIIVMGLKLKDKIKSKEFLPALRTFVIGCCIANIFGLNMVLGRIPFSMTSLRVVLLPFIFGYVFSNVPERRFSLDKCICMGITLLYAISFVASIAGGASGCSPFKFVDIW